MTGNLNQRARQYFEKILAPFKSSMCPLRLQVLGLCRQIPQCRSAASSLSTDRRALPPPQNSSTPCLCSKAPSPLTCAWSCFNSVVEEWLGARSVHVCPVCFDQPPLPFSADRRDARPPLRSSGLRRSARPRLLPFRRCTALLQSALGGTSLLPPAAKTSTKLRSQASETKWPTLHMVRSPFLALVKRHRPFVQRWPVPLSRRKNDTNLCPIASTGRALPPPLSMLLQPVQLWLGTTKTISHTVRNWLTAVCR